MKTKIETFDGLTTDDIEMIVELADPDGAYSLLEDQGKFDAAEYISEKYFE